MKEFIFEVERRVYGWMKDRLSIEAETPEEALEKLKEMAEDGTLGNEKFYICQPMAFHQILQNIQERSALYAFKIATAYFREQGLVPVFKDCHCKLMKL